MEPSGFGKASAATHAARQHRIWNGLSTKGRTLQEDTCKTDRNIIILMLCLVALLPTARVGMAVTYMTWHDITWHGMAWL